MSWPAPVAGSYAVTVVAKDSKTGLSGQGVVTVVIAKAAPGPVITAPAMTGPPGKLLTGSISLSDPGASAISVSISGVPAGMTFAVSGQALLVSWANPVQGNYTLTILAHDNLGLSGQVAMPVTVTAK